MAFCECKLHQAVQQGNLTRRLNDYADGYRDGESDRPNADDNEP